MNEAPNYPPLWTRIGVLLLSEDFSAFLLDLSSAWFFGCCRLCLTTGVAALSASSAACEGTAAQIQSPAASTNTARPLALMVM